jgi:hypothetical protein
VQRIRDMQAIVLTYDRYRAIAEHMILQYERLWPDHPFIFQVPYQNLRGTDSPRVKYRKASGGKPADIPATVLELLENVDDEEWIYWCMDDKYPVRLVIDKIARFIPYTLRSPDMSGLLFCRCRVTLGRPDLALRPGERVTPEGDILLERKAWYQIWLHQLLKAKVLRYLFSNISNRLTSGKALDAAKDAIPKLDAHRLFVTKTNLAVFGESTHGGVLTKNCYDSIRRTNIKLPEWFQHHNRERVLMGKL